MKTQTITHKAAPAAFAIRKRGKCIRYQSVELPKEDYRPGCQDHPNAFSLEQALYAFKPLSVQSYLRSKLYEQRPAAGATNHVARAIPGYSTDEAREQDMGEQKLAG